MHAFQPEFAGKMNFYLSAVNDLLRHPDDQPSIGLILCKTRDHVVAEYALRDFSKADRYLGVSFCCVPPRDLEGRFAND